MPVGERYSAAAEEARVRKEIPHTLTQCISLFCGRYIAEAIKAKQTVLSQTQRGICAVVAVSGESFASSNTVELASSARA